MRHAVLALVVAVPGAVFAQAASDADYWITRYDGADLVSGQYACGKPEIPSQSRNGEDVKKVSGEFRAWQSCYERQAQHLQDVNQPVGKVIPKPVLEAMSVEQRTKALDHLEDVYDKVAAQVAAEANAVLHDFDLWKRNTTRALASSQEYTKDVMAQMEADRRNWDLRHEPVSSVSRPKW